MQYIVLDLEWNQPWPGSPSARKVLPVPISGEIIQVGAVRLKSNQSVADEFQVLIQPKYYRRLNSRVSKLTGIKEARLREEGLPFPEAMERFRAWCGEDCIFLTWGFDDIRMLSSNLQLFGLETQWVQTWYNAQMIFNAQVGGDNAQKALSTAMEIMKIPTSRPAHDALGDAYHTALICSKLDLKRGIAEYGGSLRSHEDGLNGMVLPDCLGHKVYRGYPDKARAISDMSGNRNQCPECGAKMQGARWYSQPGKRYMTLASCPEHGKFLVRIRLSKDADGTLRVSRLVYSGDSDAARALERQADKPQRKRRFFSSEKKKETKGG